MNNLIYFLDGPFVEAIGWTLLHSLWQGAVVMIMLAVILGLTQGRNAHIRYGFATTALMLMLLWSGITFVSYYSQPVESQVFQSEEWASETEFYISPAIALDTSLEASAPASSNFFFWMDKLEGFMHINSPFIAAFWLFGSMLFFLKWLGGLLYIHRIRRTAIAAISSSWQKKLDRLAKRMGILRNVKLVESIRVHTPMVVGHFKPLILVPVGMLTGMNPEQIETILIHELAHIRRNDYLINLIQSVLEVIYFYHPAYWWIADKMHQEREHCCDDIAVAVCGNAMLYARALTEVQARKYEKAPAMALAATGKKNHLMNRVKRLLVPEQERANMAGKVILSFIMLMSVWSFAWVEEIPNPGKDTERTIPQIDFDIYTEVLDFEPPSIGLQNFELGSEHLSEPIPAPELVPEPSEIPEIEPIAVPDAQIYVSPFPGPEIAEVVSQNGAMRFNFEFSDLTTSLQHFFQFSFAVVDTPRPFVYRFAPPPPNIPDAPPPPRIEWDNEEAKRAYEEAERMYKEQYQSIREEQLRWYEEALRMQEEYAKYYEEREKEFHEGRRSNLSKSDQVKLERLQKKALIEQKLSEEARSSVVEAEELKRRLRQKLENGAISEKEYLETLDATESRLMKSLSKIERAERALEVEQRYFLEKLSELEGELAAQSSLNEVGQIKRERYSLQNQLSAKQAREIAQQKYEEQMKRKMAMQKLQMEENMRETEQQMRKMEEEIKKQQEQINREIERLGRAIKSELIEDGYIDSMDDNLYINIHDNFIKVNGKKVKDRHYKKYIMIMEDHDLQFGKGSDFTIRF